MKTDASPDNEVSVTDVKKLTPTEICENIVELSRRLGVTAKNSVRGTDPKTWSLVELCVLEGLANPTKLAKHKLLDLLAVTEMEVARIGKGGNGSVVKDATK